MKRIAICSDTHNYHNSVAIPDCDIFIHAGDFCHNGTRQEAENFAKWLGQIGAPQKILCPGNHDKFGAVYTNSDGSVIEWENDPAETSEFLDMLLDGSGTTQWSPGSWAMIPDIGKVWTMPFVPYHSRVRNMPYVLDDINLQKRTQEIDADTAILICHAPPSGFLSRGGWPFANDHLKLRIDANEIDFGLLVCGHVHPGHGELLVNGRLCLNAAVPYPRRLQPKYPVYVVDWYDAHNVVLIS